MAWFSGPGSPPRRSSSYSHSHSESHRRHSSRSPSRHGSVSRGSVSHEKQDHEKQNYWVRPAASSSNSHSHSTSRGYSSRARPRSGFVNRMVAQIKRYLRDIYRYARKNPVKLFMLVIMPLITGGALADILRRFGIRLPGGLQSMIGGKGGRGGSRFGGSEFGGAGGVEGIMKIAKMFI